MIVRPRLEAMLLKAVCVAEPDGTYIVRVVLDFNVQKYNALVTSVEPI